MSATAESWMDGNWIRWLLGALGLAGVWALRMYGDRRWDRRKTRSEMDAWEANLITKTVDSPKFTAAADHQSAYTIRSTEFSEGVVRVIRSSAEVGGHIEGIAAKVVAGNNRELDLKFERMESAMRENLRQSLSASQAIMLDAIRALDGKIDTFSRSITDTKLECARRHGQGE